MSILQTLLRSQSSFRLLVFLMLLVFSQKNEVFGQCSDLGYSSARTTGNQSWTGQLAMTFATSNEIRVTELGVFDDNAVEGISGSISVGIIDAAGTTTLVGPISISGTTGTLNGRYRMVQLASPVILPAGTYHIKAVGFGVADPNGNAGLGGAASTLSASPVISYGGNSYNGTALWDNSLPGTADGGPTGRYHAGTFNFEVVTPLITTSVLGTTITNPGPVLLTRQLCNNNNLVTATPIIQTNTSDNAFVQIDITSSNNINLAGGGPGADLDRLDDLPLDNFITTIGPNWMNFIDDIRLANGAQDGFVVIRIRPYTDMDGSDDLTVGDCVGAQIELRFEIQPIPQTISTFVNPIAQDGEVCSGATIDVDLSTNNFLMIGGTPRTPADYEFEIVQIRYSTDGGATYPPANSGYPVGLTGGTYSVGNIISSGVAQINETLINNNASPVYLRYQVMAQLTNTLACADAAINIRIVINPNPSAAISPDPAAVCEGVNLALDGNPTGGSGTFTTHSWTGAGATSLNVTNAQAVTFNNSTAASYALTYTVTDDNGCTGTDAISVTVNDNPVANITPEPAEACILTDIQLNGNPTGGNVPFTHLWTGAGSPYLSSTAIVNPIFNHNQLGPYEVTYTVTDVNGCIGSDVLTINLTDNADPTITCPVGPIVMNTDVDSCNAVVCFPITTSDDCPFYYPPTLTDHVYIGTYGGNTYFYSVNAMSWEAANSAATALGGNLVNIQSVFEQGFLGTNVPTPSNFWIGLRYSRALGAYKWTSGAPVNYTNWAFGEPNLFGSHDYVFYLEINSPFFNGWHDIPSVVFGTPINMQYIIEFSGLPETLIAGLPSGSIFPLGDTQVTYETEDSAGNTDECTFTVTVVDNQNPVVTCPEDVSIYLEPLECEGVGEYEATATDNCSIASIDYSIPSGSLFPIGINPVTVTATDGSGNTAECTFNVWIFDYINPSLACKPVNLSLDELCSTEIDPTIFLTGWQGPNPGEVLIGCLDNFIITFMKDDGTIIPVDQLKHHIGKTLQVKVSHTMQSFTCWNTVLIEDKYPPAITCRDLEVSCLAATDNLIVAFASDNCTAEPVLVNEVHEMIQCDEDYIGKITRRYIAVDKFGNQSADTCTATIYLERSRFGGIVRPADDKLICSEEFAEDNKGYGHPSPTETGVPTYNLIPVYPNTQFNMLYCNASIDYDDVVLLDTPCKKKIRRTWKIYEWHCSSLETFIIGTPQIIDIVDDVAPVIPEVEDIFLTTRTKACTGTAYLPELKIEDNCNDLKHVYVNVFNDNIPVGTLPTNGGILELPVGVNIVEYTAIDICGNTASRRFIITVRDDTNPIAVCDQFTTVSIKTNGFTEVTATAVDDGSFDECGDVELLLRRMEDPCGTNFHIGWHEKVGFCCLDANQTRMVTLLVTDKGGNTNMCMVSVNVQEKVNPSIVCPNDLTITDCTYTFDPNNADYYFGAADIIDNCPANNIVVKSLDDQRNQCGIGQVVRTFEVRSGNISYGTCTQTITFENNEPFDGLDPNQLDWPDDYTAVNQCNILNLEPEMLPPGFNFPVINQDVCDRVGFTKEDLVFPFTTNGACFKIIRKWTVIDWCQTDMDGNYLTWTHEQEIKVMDNVDPQITSPDTSRVIFSYDAACLGGLIELTASAEDCTPEEELSWTYTIYDSAGAIYETGTGNDASGIYPLGDYLIEFTVEDRCGNLANTSYTFEIISAKSATPICFEGLSTDLIAMDLDNSGTLDTAMVTIPVTFFNNHSYHDCYPGSPLVFSYSPDINDNIRVFGCDDLGLQPITMYVTDINGNQSFCTTSILITNNDPDYECPGQMLVGSISGKIVTEKNLAIEDVNVKLEGTEIDSQTTETTGSYAFTELPLGYNYSIVPEKDIKHDNGVSTLDIVLIQRHILGIQKLPGTYKYIAADINNDKKINTVDLVELRKLVLGSITRFPSNTSWKFVEKDYQFMDPTNPLALFIPGMCAISNLQQSIEADFIGIKIGDVNESAEVNGIKQEKPETRHYFAFEAENRSVKAGEEFVLNVKANSNVSLFGWQQKLVMQDAECVEVLSGFIDGIEEQSLNTIQEVSFSIAIADGKAVNNGQTVFSMTLKALKDGQIKDMIHFDNEGLQSEVYANGVEKPGQLNWKWRDVVDQVFDITKHQPNPWKESTLIGFTIPKDDIVSVKVKDQTGRTVYSAVEYYQAGEQQVEITRDAIQTSGLYFVELKFNNEVKTVKTIMID
ncbi:MAG: HYR domain-containing protein [Saprospiraceae bacterium]|nr:HYR domain-containing protein [Saprospiraceae bacterium]